MPVHVEETHKIPNDNVAGTPDAFASKDWRTKCMVDHSLNGVIITSLTLISCPFITERRTCRPVSVVHWAASRTSIATAVSDGSRLVPRVSARLVILCHRQPWFPVVIQPHREDVDLYTPYLFILGSVLAVPSSPDLVRQTEDPLSARYLRPLESYSTLTHDPSSPG